MIRLLPSRTGRWLRVVVALGFALSIGCIAAPAQAVSSTIVISQVYGGGGNTGATYKNDFIELFNRGASAVDISGWSVQYAASTGTSWTVTNLSGTIQPGHYYLVQGATAGGGSVDLPTPDASGSIQASATNGKVALINSTTALSGSCPAAVVDFVGYGTANCSEGTAAAAPANSTTSLIRATGGCTETDSNSSDFAAGTADPRNSATPSSPCAGTPADQPINPAGPATLVTPVGVATSTQVSASDADSIVNGASITSTAVAGITLENFVAATTDGGTATATLNVAASVAEGTYPVVITFTNNEGQSATLNIAVTVNPPAGVCPTPPSSLVTIPALQGTTDTNTANGQAVTLRGVVVADVQGATGQNGFYIQDPTGDNNAQTSDGVFIFVPSANSAWFSFDVAVGEAVQVSGTATEFQGLTEITNVTSIVKCGTNMTIAPTTVTLPETTNGALERYEGMLIAITQTLTVDQNYFQGRYGQVTLSSGGRLYNPTNLYDAGSAQAIALADENARRLIVLDDAKSSQNPNPIPYIGADNTLRAGDTTTGPITGTLDFGPINSDSAIRDYRIQPTAPVSFARANVRTAAPTVVGGNVKVASANVLNYFTTLDAGSNTCYSSSGPTDCRGANSAAELKRQRDKIVSELTAINADVFGLMEVENNGPTAVGDIVAGLNEVQGAGTYAVVSEPTNDPISDTTRLGGDAIKVAMIYKPATVTPLGAALSSPDTIFSRAPFAQSFTLNANGEVFSVIVNHFKSKGSCPSSASDPNADQGDGQGCWNAQRVQQAQALLGLISTVTAATGDDDVLVIGDLNSYGMEDPIQVLTTGGLVNEVAKRVGPTAYSYVFDGLAGYLDHALASASLDGQVRGVTEWHVNADEPSVIDYNTEFKPQDLYTATPYRASDHDPVVISLQLGAPGPALFLPIVKK